MDLIAVNCKTSSAETVFPAISQCWTATEICLVDQEHWCHIIASEKSGILLQGMITQATFYVDVFFFGGRESGGLFCCSFGFDSLKVSWAVKRLGFVF